MGDNSVSEALKKIRKQSVMLIHLYRQLIRTLSRENLTSHLEDITEINQH